MQTAIASKRKATYKAYATYYGVDDDDLFAYQNKEREDLPKAKVKSEYKSVLYLTLFLIVLAILYGAWKAPESSNGKISLGQGELSSWSILMVFIIMIGTIAFILKPLLHSYGFGWLTIIVCLVIVALLYRLFGRELTILDPKNEKK
jgi:vacuolar-type H+-ATPase subunit I/STV1